MPMGPSIVCDLEGVPQPDGVGQILALAGVLNARRVDAKRMIADLTQGQADAQLTKSGVVGRSSVIRQ
jgi:hypothetical protein